MFIFLHFSDKIHYNFSIDRKDNFMKYHVLFNPLAGNGECYDKLEELKSIYGDSAEFNNITEIENFREYITSFEEDDKIVVCGGDGTLNRFVNNIENLDIENEILYFAQGTGNDFIRDVKDQDTTKPFPIARYIKDLPIVEVNGKSYRFINGVGYGIDGYCCEVGDNLKAIPGKKVNYTMIAIKGLLFHYKPCGANVTVDGKSYRYEKVWIAPTMNGKYYGGGMIPTPEQDRFNEEGTVSVMLFHGSSKLRTLMVFPSIFKGEHVKNEDIVTIHKGHNITVEFDKPQSLQIDGETILGVKGYKVSAKKTVCDAV